MCIAPPFRTLLHTAVLLVLLAGCGRAGGSRDALAPDTLVHEDGFPQAEIWIGSSTEPEEEPIHVGDRVRVEVVKVIRAREEPDWDAERRARIIWTSRNPAVATVDSAGRVTAVSVGRATIVAELDPATLPEYAPTPEGDSTYVRVLPPDPALDGLRFRTLALARSEVRANNCAITHQDAVYCWGNDLLEGDEGSDRLRQVAGAPPFTTLTRGESHDCGLAADGRAFCWGESDWGALGTGSTRARRPTPAAGGLRFVQLSAGRTHTCGVTPAGDLYCWGSNMAGELGARTSDRCPFPISINHRTRVEHGACSRRPVRVLPGVTVRAVATGDAHTCALDAQGRPWCWGDDFDEQVPRAGARPTPVATQQRFTALWAGSRHTCALTAQGRAYCWGRNWIGQMGMESPRRSRAPVAVPVDVAFTSLTLGDEHTCGIAADGRAWCWGDNRNHALGTGIPDGDQRGPAPVAGGLRFRQLAAGRVHTCGVTLAGGLYCWGSGLDFDLAGGTFNDRPEPVRVAGPPS